MIFCTQREYEELRRRACSRYRPLTIVRYKEEIDRKILEVESRARRDVDVDFVGLDELRSMHLKLMRLYVLWVRGKIR